MRRAAGRHPRYRELISARLDGLLAGSEARELEEHLEACEWCRAIEREYDELRSRLHALPERPVPRDLRARTTVALDREISRRGARLFVPEPTERVRRMRRVVVLGAAGLAAVIVGAQLGDAPPRNVALPDPNPDPTPFSVPHEDLAFVAVERGAVTLYEADVDQLCPALAADCAPAEAAAAARLVIPQEVAAADLAVDPNGERLAILARNDGSEDIYTVDLQPAGGDQSPDQAGLRQRRNRDAARDEPRGRPSRSERRTAPPDRPVTRTEEPATDKRVPRGLQPRASDPPTNPSPPPRASASAPPPERRRDAPDTGGPARGTRPILDDDQPARTPSAEDREQAAERARDQYRERDVDRARLWQWRAGPRVNAILEDVLTAGAPPAWSPDGSMLAFSAMPADGSHGPDVYVWRSGEARARPVTRDHGSYFASWSGSRIVVSRLRSPAAGVGDPFTVNFLVDPTTGTERSLWGRDLWLPSVDPSGRFAITWRGRLELDGDRARPEAGELYLVDWRSITSRGRGRDRVSADAPAAEEPEREAPANESGAASSEEPSWLGWPPSTAAGPPGENASRASSPPAASPAATPATGGRHVDRHGGDPEATTDTGNDRERDRGERFGEPRVRLTPLELGRDTDADPVVDWHVRWARNGRTAGVWTVDTERARWGELRVLFIDTASGRIDRDAPRLGPMVARRGFTLGRDRIAWIAPTDDAPHGQLRVRAWSPNGFGVVRIETVDVGEGIPSF